MPATGPDHERFFFQAIGAEKVKGGMVVFEVIDTYAQA
jgi:hypothetical protein